MARRSLGAGYWRMFWATTASNLGDGVLQVALPLYVAGITRDPLAVAGTAFAQQLPWTLTAPIAGVVADRADRKRIMVSADLARFGLLGAFAVVLATGTDSLALTYAVAFALGALESLFDVTAGTMVPALVRPEQYDTANGRLFAAELIAENFAAPPVGALLFAAAAAIPFGFDAATFALSAVLLAGLAGRYRNPRSESTREATAVSRAWSDAKAGIARMWSDVRLRGLMITSAVIGIAEWAVLAVLVLFALEELGTSDLGFALLFAVTTVGAFAGSVSAARLGAGFAERTFVVSTAAHGVLAVFVAFSPSVWLAAAALTAWGFAVGVSNVMYVGIRQRVVPSEWLGRVGGSLGLINGIAGTVGAIGAGALAQAGGVRAPIAVSGLLEAVVVTAVGWWWLRQALLGTRTGAGTGTGTEPGTVPRGDGPGPASGAEAAETTERP